MTANQFRKIALGLEGTTESAHMNHPDFRVAGKIFATLGFPGDERGMVKLPPDLQEQFIKKSAGAFTPCTGAWGRAGCTSVHLPLAKAAILKSALRAAWRNALTQAGKKRK